DEAVVGSAAPRDLLLLGNALAFLDVRLVGDLAQRALAAAHDDPSRLSAEHLAGLADAYLNAPDTAIAHLDAAEDLALALGEHWELASIRQMRGVALRTTSADPEVILAEFASAMRAYAAAGDATHTNNVRYMMALTAAEQDLDAEQAATWAAECVAYASAVGNEHELAHAHLVQAMLGLLSADEMRELLDTFRHVGDLRCVTRTLVIMADAAAPSRQAELLAEALAVAETAGDQARQEALLERLAGARWAAGSRMDAVSALDRLAVLAGPEAAVAAAPAELRAELLVGSDRSRRSAG
ncbi:MAG: hypothetical protein ABWX62_04190, partial [Microterricola sp.]